MRVVCPKCKGGRWLRDVRFGSSIDRDPVACPSCMSIAPGGKGMELDPRKEIEAIQVWLANWAREEGIRYATVGMDEDPDPPLPI